jgi:hypothetical protein
MIGRKGLMSVKRPTGQESALVNNGRIEDGKGQLIIGSEEVGIHLYVLRRY